MKLKDLIPGELEITSKELGVGNLLKFIGKSVWSYKRTMWYIIRHVGLRDFVSFLYTKALVPTGSGAGGALYFILGPLVRKYPLFLYRSPIAIEIELTTVCDKKCILCEQTWWDEKSQSLSLEEVKYALDSIPSLRWFGPTGEGDPLLIKDIIPILRYAKGKGITVWLDESFDRLDKTVAKEFIDMGLDGIMMSFDAGTKETYEFLKDGCKFERTINNVRTMIELKKEVSSPLPEIIVRSVVSSASVNEMPEIVDTIANIAPPEDFGDTARIQFIGVLRYPEIDKYVLKEIPQEQVNETKRRSLKRNWPVIFAHTEPGKYPSINKCLNWMEPYMFMKGEIVPCCAVMMSNSRDYLRERSLGNVFKIPFKDIWNSPRYREFRKTINKPNAPVPQFCLGCRAYDHKERQMKHGVNNNL